MRIDQSITAHALVHRVLIRKKSFQLVRVVSYDETENVFLVKAGFSTAKVPFEDIGSHYILYPSVSEVKARWPHLVQAIGRFAAVRDEDAAQALRGLIVNGPFDRSSEATAHFGGAAFLVRAAMSDRHELRYKEAA